MIEDAFNLRGSPFRLSPDPKFFFGSRSHRKALAYLRYGVQQGEGFIVITGEIGAGKSILIGQLLSELDHSRIAAAHLVTSSIEANDIVRFILAGFKIKPAGESRASQISAFEEFLIAQHRSRRRVLLVVDEAQNIPPQTIEELRMLSNINYDGDPLFQIFLVGQPEFRDILAQPTLEQLRQRVIASYHLNALAEDETKEYIIHRLNCVGWRQDPSFTDEAFRIIHEQTGGVPRLINNLCNRLLLSCAIDEVHVIESQTVRDVVADISTEEVVDSTGPGARQSSSAAAALKPAGVNGAGDMRIELSNSRKFEGEIEAAETLEPAYADKISRRARELEERAQRLEAASGRIRETILLRLARMEEALQRLEDGATAAE